MSLPLPSYNDDPKSFAYPTVHKRWPTILEGAIGDIASHIRSFPEAQKCGEIVTSKIESLLKEFRADEPVKAFTEEELQIKKELIAYNSELERYNNQRRVTWLTGPWLYLECYLYQLLDLWFKQTIHLKEFDVFENSKSTAFQQSSFGVLELCKRYETLSKQLQGASVDQEALKLLFYEFIDISLWGNATDLSLLAGNVTLEDIKSVQGAEVRKKNEEKIIVNDAAKAWHQLTGDARKRVDFVLDNSGFELFADLCLSMFLLDSGLVESVVLHCKEIPWFVSDTMPKDFESLIEQLKNAEFFTEIHSSAEDKKAIEFFTSKLEALVGQQKISLQHNLFWTSYENFWYIPEKRGLFEELRKSSLVIFKGDLNYRKLTGDLQWDTTTPFVTAIRQLGSSGLPVLALRTCKADVVVGLPEGLNEKLSETYKSMGNDVGEFWTASGKWAVISFSSGLP
ncbi:DUF89-domain-containing protein [Metschnikowia bicuspidata var. bicuspidata NRRL YB-4993]|uniref:Sugar phosphate phosphatase n=1 Tax=Metschnikowia bicuspidata var. bicuspidata NRRL YB-4993 TaxID=869754 RepID=A0A1A0HG02_9ASCO|nr:DUF89-domain-containing protein [Metschnikowia bicuspidata var. bicuspidata NRRL YB-4993]OBA22931.1 DUF89-domain-containing protein [Metschnikowia bicuspidata var. bicuspidata NRRL YB-4993]